ncbi:MAG: KamA family radical SAM protein [Pirellulales bacterium]|nr:KamA family radical SAM protein [Pirellulales bacterium]
MASTGILTRSDPAPPDAPAWSRLVAGAIRDGAELCDRLGLPRERADDAPGFPALVPEPFLARIRPGDPGDPLLRQVLPTREEQVKSPGFTPDPLGESAAIKGACLLAKYANRSLIVASGACAVHCRFCFRRHFRPADPPSEESIASAIGRLAADPSVHEVVLSGGDPLGLDDPRLAWLLARLADVASLRRVRVHTRFPVAIPQRVTASLIETLRGTRLVPIAAVHVNHPAEIDRDVAAALGRFVDAGIPVLGQTVLLRGVNDCADTLATLFERLVDLRVMPYYLHQLDRVAGAAHFEVSETVGIRLIAELRARLPGYAAPRYVREVPGEPGKRVLA